MYGMVNRAIEDLVITTAGEEAWENIKHNTGLELGVFIDSGQYEDDVTYKLVESASKVLGQSPEAILRSFGRHWILYTGKEGWASVFDLGGDNLLDYINGLDSMHARVQIALPDADMPEFSVIEHDDYYELCYRSSRHGLASMVLGLLDGLAEQFDEQWDIEHVVQKSESSDDIFHLRKAQLGGLENKADAA